MFTSLLQHLKIDGNREEMHWHNTWDFNHDFKAFLGHVGMFNKNINFEKGTILMTSTGIAAIEAITGKAAEIEPSIGSGFITKGNNGYYTVSSSHGA